MANQYIRYPSTTTTSVTLAGDVTGPSGSNTLATVNSNVGTFGSATAVGQFTVDGKGRITAASDVSLQVATALLAGIVSTGAQTFAGDKTFTGSAFLPDATIASMPSLGVGNTATTNVGAKELVTLLRAPTTAEFGTVARTLSSNLTYAGDVSITAIARNLSITNTRTLTTTSTSDTQAMNGLAINTVFNVPSGLTLTSTGAIGINLLGFSKVGTGSVAITNMRQLVLASVSLANTGTNVQLDISGVSGGTVNNYAIRTSTGLVSFADELRLETAGKGLSVKEGSNARMGTATLVAGALIGGNTSVNAKNHHFFYKKLLGGESGCR